MKTLKINIGIFAIMIAFALVFSSCQKDREFEPENPSRNNINSSIVKAAQVQSGSSVQLFAGQSIEAGTVDISIVGDLLHVAYNTTNGFELVEAHLFVGENLSDMPQSKNGNPKIGNFPYSKSGLSGISYEFLIPLADLGGEPYICDKFFYLAAHASLQRDNGDGSFQYETGWGDGARIVQRGSWATYFTIEISCTDDQEPTPIQNCETAFALSDLTFIDLGLTSSRWGWVVQVDAQGDYSTPIYAGAGQNDLSKGTLVGTFNYSYDGSSVIASFDMLEGFTMSENQLYVSNLVPETIAPGQYGNIHGDLTNASYDTYSVPVSGDVVYIIAHAVVCSDDF